MGHVQSDPAIAMRKGFLRAVACAGAMLACTAALAQIKVENPWVRGAVPGQLSTGAFLDITSARDATIVKAESPIAATVEVTQVRNVRVVVPSFTKYSTPAAKERVNPA